MLPGPLNSATVRVARAVNRRWARSIRLTEPAWAALNRELDLWSQRRRQARFWWRDDDAEDSSRPLEQLLGLRESSCIPLAVAVVPAAATDRLAAALHGVGGVCVLQHGWNHDNHAPANRPRAEFAEGRNAQDMAADLFRGRMKLQNLFGRQFLPILVPPYNFLARSLSTSVAAMGFSFVSVEGDFSGLPLPCRNVHIDPIDWKGPAAKDAGAIVRQALAALRLRRFGLVSPASPVGIVTHHLKHDADAWQSTEMLFDRLVAHPAATFPPLAEIFSS
jgi:hypothetical protein